MKYIDAEKLKVEIEKLSFNNCKEFGNGKDLNESFGSCDAYKKVLSILASLQQEQTEMELDFQVFAKEMDAVLILQKDVTENTEENPLNWEYAIAHHFYELGRARKED